MQSHSAISLLFYVKIFSLLSEFAIKVTPFDILVDGTQMVFTGTHMDYTSNNLWSDECENRDMEAPPEFATLIQQVDLTDALDSYSGTPVKVWTSRYLHQGAYICQAAVQDSSLRYNIVSLACDADRYVFVCQGERPEIRKVPAASADSGANSLECHLDITSATITFDWFLDGLAMPLLTDQFSYGTVSDDMIGNYTCIATVNGHVSPRSDPFFLIDADTNETKADLVIPDLILESPRLSAREDRTKPGGLNWMDCRVSRLDVSKYIWRKDAEMVDGRGNIKYLLNFTHLDAGNYTCAVVINGNVSPESNMLAINMIVPQPTLIIVTEDLGEEATLQCESQYNGDVGRSYTWYQMIGSTPAVMTGYPISGDTLTINILSPDDAKDYTCVETISGVNSPKAAMQSLSFQVPQPVIITTGSMSIVAGDSVMLFCYTGYSSSVPSRQYRWFRSPQPLTILQKYNGGDVNTLESRTSSIAWQSTNGYSLSITSFGAGDALRYSCAEIISNRISALSDQLELTATVASPTFTTNPGEITLGTQAKFLCSLSTSQAILEWKWLYSNNADGNYVVTDSWATKVDEVIINSPQPEHLGYYACIVRFTSGTDSPQSDWLLIDFKVPQPTVSPNPIALVTLGESVTLTCNSPYVQSRDPSDRVISGITLDLLRSYRWFWIHESGVGTREHRSVSDQFTINGFLYDHLGNMTCTESILDNASSESDFVVFDFSVPKPELVWLDPRPTVDFLNYVDFDCQSAYGEFGESMTRTYSTFFRTMAANPMHPFKLSEIDSVTRDNPVLPVWGCKEEIDGKESPLSDWLELNITLNKPKMHESWDADSNQTVFTCQHGYNHWTPDKMHGTKWYNNLVEFPTTGFDFLENNQLVLYDLTKADDSRTIACSLYAYDDVESEISSEIIVEEKMNKPTLRSTSRSSVPSGSTVTLRCIWKDDYDNQYRLRRNGRFLNRQLNNNFKIQKFVESDNGNYTCRVKVGPKESRESEPVYLETVDPFALCYCPCDNTTLPEKNITKEVVKQIVSEIKSNLTVEKSTLSASIRVKTSAPDKRLSSVGAGYAAITLITGCLLLIVVPDMISLTMWIIVKSRVCAGTSASVDIVTHIN